MMPGGRPSTTADNIKFPQLRRSHGFVLSVLIGSDVVRSRCVVVFQHDFQKLAMRFDRLVKRVDVRNLVNLVNLSIRELHDRSVGDRSGGVVSGAEALDTIDRDVGASDHQLGAYSLHSRGVVQVKDMLGKPLVEGLDLWDEVIREYPGLSKAPYNVGQVRVVVGRVKARVEP